MALHGYPCNEDVALHGLAKFPKNKKEMLGQDTAGIWSIPGNPAGAPEIREAAVDACQGATKQRINVTLTRLDSPYSPDPPHFQHGAPASGANNHQ